MSTQIKYGVRENGKNVNLGSFEFDLKAKDVPQGTTLAELAEQLSGQYAFTKADGAEFTRMLTLNAEDVADHAVRNVIITLQGLGRPSTAKASKWKYKTADGAEKAILQAVIDRNAERAKKLAELYPDAEIENAALLADAKGLKVDWPTDDADLED